MLGIGGDGLDCLGRRPKQDVMDNGLVLQRDAGDRRWHGEYEMKARKQLALAIGQPLGAGETLALWAETVTAGVVGNAGLTAIIAALDIAAERRGPANLNRRHDAALSGSQATGLIGAVGGTMGAEDIRHLKRGSHTGRSARRHHHQAIERARRVGDQCGCDLGISGGRRQPGMAQQHLNDADVRAGFEQVGSEAVPQGVYCHRLTPAY
jgi:hypothetical protein